MNQYIVENIATIILAAGKGTRIGKLTCTRPKATLKLNGLSIIRRTCELLFDHSDQIIIVGGKNALKLGPELSWIPGKKLLMVSTPILSDLGCAASLKAGLKVIRRDITQVNIIEGDIVLTDEAVNRVMKTNGKIKVAVTDESKESDGKVFWDPLKSKYYISHKKRETSHICKGKFVGFTSLSKNLVEIIENKIPPRSMGFCSDYIQLLLNNSTQFVELGKNIVGEIDCPEDYRKILKNKSINKLLIPRIGSYYSLIAKNQPLKRFIAVSNYNEAVIAQNYGFDGIWLECQEISSDSLQKQLKILNKLKEGNFILPIVYDFKQVKFESSSMLDLLNKLACLPVEGICIQLSSDSRKIIKETKSYLAILQKKTMKSPHKLTILFRLNSIRGEIGKKLINLHKEVRPIAMAFVEDFHPENTALFSEYEKDDGPPIAVFTQSYDVSLERLDKLKYFAVVYSAVRTFSDNEYRRLLIKLSSCGYLTNSDLNEVAKIHDTTTRREGNSC